MNYSPEIYPKHARAHSYKGLLSIRLKPYSSAPDVMADLQRHPFSLEEEISTPPTRKKLRPSLKQLELEEQASVTPQAHSLQSNLSTDKPPTIPTRGPKLGTWKEEMDEKIQQDFLQEKKQVLINNYINNSDRRAKRLCSIIKQTINLFDLQDHPSYITKGLEAINDLLQNSELNLVCLKKVIYSVEEIKPTRCFTFFTCQKNIATPVTNFLKLVKAIPVENLTSDSVHNFIIKNKLLTKSMVFAKEDALVKSL